VGNRLTKTEGSVTDDYNYYPSTNKLNKVVTDTDTVTYTCDLNGNITSIGDMVLTYNQNNRLVMVEEDSVTLGEYTYNGLGQRIIKEVDEITTIFHYDFDGNIIAESDESGNFSKEYLYRGSSRLALVDVETGELYYYGNDRLGTPQILTDSTNTVVWEAVYDPFGEADVNPNSSVVNDFRFPGQYYDEETGLHYNYHRYYDPQTGRYLTPDPIGLAGGDMALYSYSLDNPINLSDSDGKQWQLYLQRVLIAICEKLMWDEFKNEEEKRKLLNEELKKMIIDNRNALRLKRNQCIERCKRKYIADTLILDECKLENCLSNCTDEYMSNLEELVFPLEEYLREQPPIIKIP
jgi:RHS repeat-associated protein